MSTETLELPVETDKLSPITQAESEITRIRTKAASLTIVDHNDKKGFEAVYQTRQEAARLRVDVEKTRKALVEDSVKWQKIVNSTANPLESNLKEIESGLKVKEDAYHAEKQRIKDEAERLRKARNLKRLAVITSLDPKFNGSGYTLGEAFISQDEIENLPDADFQTKVELFEAEYQIILDARIEAERLAKIEADRLEAQRKEQEAAALELKRQQDELAAERKKMDEEKAELARVEAARVETERLAEKAKQDAIEAEKREEKRLADLEAARVEAAEKARVETEAKAKREAEEKLENERIAKEKEARKLARRPDITKYYDMVAQVLNIVDSVTFKTEEGIAAHADFKTGIELLVKSSVLKSE